MSASTTPSALERNIIGAGMGNIISLRQIIKDNQINERDSFGYTALMRASRNGHVDVVELALENKAEVNLTNHGWSPLMSAANENQLKVIQTLLTARANPNLKDKYGFTALSLAASYGHSEVVMNLLEQKANPNTEVKTLNKAYVHLRGVSPLLLASRHGHLHITKALVEAKATLDVTDAHAHRTPLYEAAKRGHLGIVTILVEAKADLNIQETEGLRSAVMIAFEEDHEEVMDLLVEARADLLLEDVWGDTLFDMQRNQDSQPYEDISSEGSNFEDLLDIPPHLFEAGSVSKQVYDICAGMSSSATSVSLDNHAVGADNQEEKIDSPAQLPSDLDEGTSLFGGLTLTSSQHDTKADLD